LTGEDWGEAYVIKSVSIDISFPLILTFSRQGRRDFVAISPRVEEMSSHGTA
jgi:hypothetical protein